MTRIDLWGYSCCSSSQFYLEEIFYCLDSAIVVEQETEEVEIVYKKEIVKNGDVHESGLSF